MTTKNWLKLFTVNFYKLNSYDKQDKTVSWDSLKKKTIIDAHLINKNSYKEDQQDWFNNTADDSSLLKHFSYFHVLVIMVKREVNLITDWV